MATRFYPAVKAPNAIIHGPCAGAWAVVSVFNRSWAPVQWQWRMATSKTNGGTHGTSTITCNQQGNFDFHFLNLWTPPLDAQTITGDLDLCFLVSAAWLDDLDPPANSSVVRWKVHAYITVGQTTTVRHVLLDNYVDGNNFAFSTLTGRQLGAPQTLTPGDAEAGDCVRVEIGFRIVSSPTPAVTQPPVNFTRILCRGLGTNAAGGDAVTGSTDLALNSWVEFSHTFTFQAAPAPPANDACADAIDIGSVSTYQGGFIDTTASAGTEREVWWTWTAPEDGQVCAHTFGANYGTVLAVFVDGCGVLNPPAGFTFPSTSLSQHRSQSTLVFTAVQGTQYWFRVRNQAGTYNATEGGGLCRFGLFYRRAPQTDDLYLPVQNLLQFREGVPVNLTAGFVGSEPSGVALDYTQRPMDDLNGGTNTSIRVLLGLFSFDTVEILDATDLSYGAFQFEIDFINLPWDTSPITKHPATLYVTAAGQLYVGWFGTGFEYVAGIGTLPSLLNTVSDDPANGYIRSLSATDGDNQAGGPFADTLLPAVAEATAPWAITMDEDAGILYFTSGSFYGFIGGTEVRRYYLSSGITDVFATIPLRPGNNPGVKGLQFLPGGGLLVCNGDAVHRLDAAGTIIGTYVPSIPIDSQELADVKLTVDGLSFWVVDLGTARLFKADLLTMTELATYETFLESGTLTQMAIYQPAGPLPPPPPVTRTGCPDALPVLPATGQGCNTQVAPQAV